MLGCVCLQLNGAGSTRQCLIQSLERERREGENARAKARELTVLLQGMKTAVQVCSV